MRLWGFAGRNLKEIIRDKFNIGFLIGMPVAFILIFGFAFGSAEETPLSLGVVDYAGSEYSHDFVGALSQAPTLEVSGYSDEAEAREDLRLGELDGIAIVPEGFNRSNISLDVVYDEAKQGMGERLVAIVKAVAVEFSDVPVPVDVKASPSRLESIGYMNYLAPGMTVYGLLILIPACASLMARDKETGMLSRLLATPLRPWEFILGYLLPYIPILMPQVAIFLGVGCAMGLQIVGSFALAFLVLFLLGLTSIAIGMIMGLLIRQEGQAHISWVFIVPMAMLSGAWFSTEWLNPILKGIAKAFPSTYAVELSQDVLTRGLGFGEIAGNFYILLGFAAALLAIAIFVFRRRVMV